MAHHAYFWAGDLLEGKEAARSFAAQELGLLGHDNPDLVILEYGLFSVEHARAAGMFASQAPLGAHKVIVISAMRLFHEAQNALLKLFEEPAEGTTLILLIPTEGIMLPTLRSRLLPLPHIEKTQRISGIAEEYLKASTSEREKMLAKLVERTKADKEMDKQEARLQAVALVEGLTREAYKAKESAPHPEALIAFLADLDRFLPILHERSAPLKLIFEHLQLTLPKPLAK